MRLRGLASLTVASALAIGLLAAVPATAEPVSTAVAPRPIVSGWFGWWASDTSIQQMVADGDGVVGEVAMFWWSFQSEDNPLCVFDNGDYDKDKSWGNCLTATTTPWTTPKFDRQRKVLQSAGIKINASITDLGSATAGELSDYLATGKRRTAYAQKITDYAVKAGVDGIDLDWENFAFNDGSDTWEATKPRWVAFIKVLGAKLHAQGLTLWATVPGGVPPFSGSGAPNPGTGYWVYAWDEITPHIDRLNIMAYDYHWDTPGAIGPNDWATLVVKSAVAQVGEQYADRVWIGAPQYGRNWPVRTGSGYVVDKDCPSGWSPVDTPVRTVVTPTSAREIAAREKTAPVWDPVAGEWTFQYWLATDGKVGKVKTSCKVKREVWFADARSALARASIVPEERIGGIAIWDFGTVQADFYPRLADYGREIAPAPTTVTVKAPKFAVYGRTTRITVETGSRVGAASGATATLYWQPMTDGLTRAKIESITLDKDGTGTFAVPADRSGRWTVSVDGSWSRKPGESPAVATKVRFAVAATASTTSPKVKTVVTLGATVAPATSGVKVTLQRRSADGTWASLKVLTSDAAGAVSAAVRPTLVKDVSYRFVAAALGYYALGTSKVITLSVQR